MHRCATGETYCSGPQRIVRCRQQNLVAIVHQRLHRHDDQLGNAVTDNDVVDGDAFDAFFLSVVHHRLARREQPLGVAVAAGVGQVVNHILQDLLRRIEAERRRIADIQLDDAVAFLLHAVGFAQHRATDVIADTLEFVRLVDLFRVAHYADSEKE